MLDTYLATVGDDVRGRVMQACLHDFADLGLVAQ
jgi:hypothetical protein